MISRVGVFCGSKNGDSPKFLEAASAFGRALAENQLDLVYGGAHHGLMGAVASAVLEGGRQEIGVVPRGLARQEFAHPRIAASSPQVSETCSWCAAIPRRWSGRC